MNASLHERSLRTPFDDGRFGRPPGGWRRRAHDIVFGSDTRAARLFDGVLLVFILASVLTVMLDSVPAIARRHGTLFFVVEWMFTVLFTVEYVMRLACVQRPLRYATSFFGIVDLLAVLPTYIAFIAPELGVLIDVRVLRLLRIFRVLKLAAYLAELRFLGQAFRDSRRKVLVFLCIVLTGVLIGGTVMYVIEGPANGFTSIPLAVYWAVTTMTTVGFGDIVPRTDAGRFVASLMMLLGWGVLAVPTGIVTAEMTFRRTRATGERGCDGCGSRGHEDHARFCKDCGVPLART